MSALVASTSAAPTADSSIIAISVTTSAAPRSETVQSSRGIEGPWCDDHSRDPIWYEPVSARRTTSSEEGTCRTAERRNGGFCAKCHDDFADAQQIRVIPVRVR